MGILGKIFSSGASNLVNSVGDAIDKNVTSKKEKLELKKEIDEIVYKFQINMEQELTERHKIDMTSDNKLSKLIRPMTLIYMIVFLSAVIILDSFVSGFNVPDVWVKLLTILLVTVFSFYFGGREIQKWILNKKK